MMNQSKIGLVSVYLELSGSFDLLGFDLKGQARQKVSFSGDKRCESLPPLNLNQHHIKVSLCNKLYCRKLEWLCGKSMAEEMC